MPRYKPVFPNLIDSSQVNTSPDPRPMSKGSEVERAENTAKTLSILFRDPAPFTSCVMIRAIVGQD